MPLKQIRLDAEVLRLAEQQKPSFLETSQYIGLLVQKALTGVDPLNTLGARPAGAGSLSSVVNKEEEERARAELINRPLTPAPKAPKDPWTLKKVSPALVPEELNAVAELFCEWWAARDKGSTRTESVAKREFKKLLAWTPEDRTKALQAAIASGWKQLYEPKPNKPAQGHYGASETPHPASKVFKASDLDWPEVTNPVLKDLF